MPRRTPTVDRNHEFDTFINLLNRSASDSISVLVIEDASGHGKTRLIERYRDYCWEHNISCAHSDLKSGSLDPFRIMQGIQGDLHLSLPRLEESLLSPRNISPSAQISRNLSLGRTTLSLPVTINVSGMTLDEQRQWWGASAQAFLDDLKYLEGATTMPVVLLFDTFEKASSETQAWLNDHILRMATPQRTPGLVVVVAGQKIPEITSEWEWCSRILSLQPLRAEDWHEYARILNADLTLEQICRFYQKYGDQPLTMAQIIDCQAR